MVRGGEKSCRRGEPPRSGHQRGSSLSALAMERYFAMSSLGTPQVQEARLVGRKELDEYHGSRGTRSYNATHIKKSLHIGDCLERNGHTFEAELVYRSLAQESKPAASRLALSLEAKGYRWDAWKLHVTLASGGEVSSLMRLAVITCQRGLIEQAAHFMQSALQDLPSKAVRHMAHVTRVVARGRSDLLSGRSDLLTGQLVTDAADKLSIDNAFNWGSILYVIAGRPDLARLAYLSALQRGHSLAAVSLLDMTPRSDRRSASQELLLELTANVRVRSISCRNSAVILALKESAVKLANDMHDEPVRSLIDEVLSPADRSGRSFRHAVERLMVNTQMFAVLQGLQRSGYNSRLTPARLRVIAERACKSAATDVAFDSPADPGAVIRQLWSVCNDAVEAVMADPVIADMPTVTPCKAAGAGIVRRMAIALSMLPRDQAQILIMRLSGLYHSEAAESLGLEKDVTRALHRAANKALRSAQIGEQLPLKLWQEVENALADVEFGEEMPIGDDPVDEDWSLEPAGLNDRGAGPS